MSIFDYATSLMFTKPASHLDLYQKNRNVIFVNLYSEDCDVKIPGIKKSNYFTRETFIKNYGVSFDDILFNYFKIYNSKNNINMTDDDILMTLNYLIKYMIENRDTDYYELSFNRKFEKYLNIQ